MGKKTTTTTTTNPATEGWEQLLMMRPIQVPPSDALADGWRLLRRYREAQEAGPRQPAPFDRWLEQQGIAPLQLTLPGLRHYKIKLGLPVKYTYGKHAAPGVGWYVGIYLNLDLLRRFSHTLALLTRQDGPLAVYRCVRAVPSAFVHPPSADAVAGLTAIVLEEEEHYQALSLQERLWAARALYSGSEAAEPILRSTIRD